MRVMLTTMGPLLLVFAGGAAAFDWSATIGCLVGLAGAAWAWNEIRKLRGRAATLATALDFLMRDRIAS